MRKTSSNNPLDVSYTTIQMKLNKQNMREFLTHFYETVKGEVNITKYLLKPKTFALQGERKMLEARQIVTELGSQMYGLSYDLDQAKALLKIKSEDFIPNYEELQLSATRENPIYLTPQKAKKREELVISEVASQETKVQLLDKCEKTMNDSRKPDELRSIAANNYEKIKHSILNPATVNRTNLEMIEELEQRCRNLAVQHGNLKTAKEIASLELVNFTALYNHQNAIFTKEVALIFNALLDDLPEGLIDVSYRHQLHSNTEVWEKMYNWQLNSELLEFIDFLKKNSSKSGLMDTLQKVTDVLNANPASNTTLAAWTDGYIKLYNLMGEVSEEIKGLALVNFHKKIIKYFNYSSVPGGQGMLQSFLMPWMRLEDDNDRKTFPKSLHEYADKLDRFVTSSFQAAMITGNGEVPTLISRSTGSKVITVAALQQPVRKPKVRICQFCGKDNHSWITCYCLTSDEKLRVKDLFEIIKARMDAEMPSKNSTQSFEALNNNSKPMNIRGKVKSLVREKAKASKTANDFQRSTKMTLGSIQPDFFCHLFKRHLLQQILPKSSTYFLMMRKLETTQPC